MSRAAQKLQKTFAPKEGRAWQENFQYEKTGSKIDTIWFKLFRVGVIAVFDLLNLLKWRIELQLV